MIEIINIKYFTLSLLLVLKIINITLMKIIMK
jgi:hypothetical protein